MAKETDILENVPPHNLEAEQSLLGSLIIDGQSIIRIADIIDGSDFYKDSHKKIFEVIQDLYERREPVDILNVTNRLIEKKQLDSVGGRTYLSSLANTVPTASHIVAYAIIVQKKATLRKLLDAASNIINLGHKEEEDVEKTLDLSEQLLFQVSQKHLKKSFTPIKEVLNEAFDRIDELHKESGQLRGLPTYFQDLDNILAGLQNSDLVILAARPSMGKTTLALDIARNIAVKSKSPVGVFSLEMSKEQLVDRLLCAEANVDLWKMRTGRLSDHGEFDDFTRIGQAMGVLSEAKIYIDDSATGNIMEIRTKARRLQSEYGLQLLIVDYLQLMEGRSQENRVQEVSEISRGLKAIARELNIPVLALSQLSRSAEQREGHIPRLADLRESGSIEQDADVVLFIYREAMYNRDIEADKKSISQVIIAKHRNGPTGKIDLFFDENRVSFKNMDKKVETENKPEARVEAIPEF